MQVAIVRTVCSPREYARAFIYAWRFLFGEFPSKAQCGVIYAQWIVETGGKHCWNWNIGNVKVTPAQVAADVPWFDLPGTWEIINGVRTVLPEGHPGRRFRAYATLDAGMAEHMAFLRNKRYAPSWTHVVAGDPDAFARALKVQGYYTASADDYARIMVAAHKEWMRSAAFDDALAEAIDASEEVTQPMIRLDQLEPEPATVHPLFYVQGDDEPPPEAA